MSQQQSVIEQAFQLIIEGYTKSEIRAKLGLDRQQWAAVLESPKLRKLFDVPVSSAYGLINEIETELFNSIEAYNLLKDKKGVNVAKERLILNQRIENLSFRYKNFIMPIKHKKEDK